MTLIGNVVVNGCVKFLLYFCPCENVNGCILVNLEARGLDVVSLERALKAEADRVKTGCRWYFFGMDTS